MAVSKRDSARAQQVVDCLLALALQGVAEAEASRGYALMVLTFAIQYADLRRINTELQEHINSDIVMLMAPWFTLELSFGNEVIERARCVLEEFKMAGDQGLVAVKARIASIKSVCRGDAYGTHVNRMRKLRSGESRFEVLEDVIKQSIAARVKYNLKQCVNNAFAKWKRSPEYKEDEEASKRSQIYEAKRIYYDDQIVNWKSMAEPGHMLVFILCGAPGKKLTCLMIGTQESTSPSFTVHSKEGRRASRELETPSSGSSSSVSDGSSKKRDATDDAVVDKFLSSKSDSLDFRKKTKRIAYLKELSDNHPDFEKRGEFRAQHFKALEDSVN